MTDTEVTRLRPKAESDVNGREIETVRDVAVLLKSKGSGGWVEMPGFALTAVGGDEEKFVKGVETLRGVPGAYEELRIVAIETTTTTTYQEVEVIEP